MNYKITTIILAVALIVSVGMQVTSKDKDLRYRKVVPTGMHQMPDGSMMRHDMQMNMSQETSHGNAMDSMMIDMTERMKGKTGDELDKVFLQDMIVHHQGAIDMAKLLQAGTKRPELQKMANDIITVQSKEITQMKGWLTRWFGI